MDKLNKEQEAQGAETAKNPTKAKKATAEAKNDAQQQHENGKYLPMVQALNFAQTVKTVQDLAQKVRQHDRLELYADQLSDFSIKKEEEDLDSRESYYNGCKIEISDDNRNTFTLKHPVLIKEVINFLKNRFEVKKAELAKQIKLPTAA